MIDYVQPWWIWIVRVFCWVITFCDVVIGIAWLAAKFKH